MAEDRRAAQTAAGLARTLCASLDCDAAAGRLRVTGSEPVLPARYPLATRAAGVLGAVGLVAAALWERRGGREQTVSVDLRHAGALMRGFYDMSIDGETLDPAPSDHLPLARAYRCADGRPLQLYAVTEPLRTRALRVLDATEDPETLQAAVGRESGLALEQRLADACVPATLVRTSREWAQHPQGRLLAAAPLVRVTRVGDAPARPLPTAARPLDGVRVLDLCRVVAGPVCGRTLGEHGAEVLSVLPDDLHWIRRAMIDTAPGKRNATLRAGDETMCAQLRTLAAQADVVCQGARPGRMAARGLGVDDLVSLAPGLVYVSVDGWGADGPWAQRPGFEPLAHAATGWSADHAGGGVPQPPAALAGDHLTGYLAALGAIAALSRRAAVGGSWHVEVSLCRTVSWLREGGPSLLGDRAIDCSPAATADLRVRLPGGFGDVLQLRPAPEMSLTPPGWRFGAFPPGTDSAAFSDRAG